MTDSDFENYIPPDIDSLVTRIEEIDINDNFVNLKREITSENFVPNVNDIPSTSNSTTITKAFNRPIEGYAPLKTTVRKKNKIKDEKNEKFTPYESMKNEPINPFGIYLDSDCVNNTEEAIDKRETALRTAVAINKMDTYTLKGFLERTLLNNALRFWQNISQNTKQTKIGTDSNFPNIITRAVEALRLEFCGEGNIIKDAATVQKYSTALLRLQLCDMCEIDKYICVFQDYYYHIYNQIPNTETYLLLFFAKIPDPWGQKLTATYKPGTTDTLGKKITHVRDKLNEWFGDAILAKMSKD
ncbi:hypothetical protein Tco_0009233 [Tanacetum coccineum]